LADRVRELNKIAKCQAIRFNSGQLKIVIFYLIGFHALHFEYK